MALPTVMAVWYPGNEATPERERESGCWVYTINNISKVNPIGRYHRVVIVGVNTGVYHDVNYGCWRTGYTCSSALLAHLNGEAPTCRLVSVFVVERRFCGDEGGETSWDDVHYPLVVGQPGQHGDTAL